MKSQIIAIEEYDQIDISSFKKVFRPDEVSLKKEMDFLRSKNGTWKETQHVEVGTIAICDMKSENPFYTRSDMKIMIGQGFFNRKLEELCVGMERGSEKTLEFDGERVEVRVKSIQKKYIPELSDEMVKQLDITGVQDVASYRKYLIRQQKQKIIEAEGWEAVQYVMKQVFEKSRFEIARADWTEMVNYEISRLKAIAESQGLELENMTPEEFEGKMPFSSYYELLSSVQNDVWDTLYRYLLGYHYAKLDGVEYGEEYYKQGIEDYMKFWHETKENAEKINTYAYYIISAYSGYFYNKVRQYVEENYFMEEN